MRRTVLNDNQIANLEQRRGDLRQRLEDAAAGRKMVADTTRASRFTAKEPSPTRAQSWRTAPTGISRSIARNINNIPITRVKRINKQILVGNVGKDPQVKRFDNGDICNVSLATSEKWTDKKSGEKKS